MKNITENNKSLNDKKEHILVCLSSAPSNARIIRTAADMANAFGAKLTAIYVETPDYNIASEDNKKRLETNQNLAKELGANVEIVFGDDIPYRIAEFARISGITRIVVGQTNVNHRHLFSKPALTYILMNHLPDVDIHIIPDKKSDVAYYPKKAKRISNRQILVNTIKSSIILIVATLLSLLFHEIGFTNSNIIMVYILGVLLTSVVTSHQAYSLVSSIASVFIFNFLFTEPRFTLTAYETGYPITFVIMFLTAYITGTFAIRYKDQARQSSKIAHRTKILFDTDQLLSKAKNKAEIIDATGQQIKKLLGRNIVIYECLNQKLTGPEFFLVSDDVSYDIDKGYESALCAVNYNRSAGDASDQKFKDDYFYLPIKLNERVFGVIGIDVNDGMPDSSENEILLSILGESALALENEKNAREKEAAAILAESEQLRANLLRTISHDLRTPLTTISGNASSLLHNSNGFDEATKRQIYEDIYDDSMWLTNLVENLLYSTRIEEGRMILNTFPELVSEIFEESMRHIRPKAKNHLVTTKCEDEFLLVRADAKLIVQVIINLVDNAFKYTPCDSSVYINATRSENMVKIKIADTGNGVSDSEKEKIFDKFYCCDKMADNRRSLGLGLYLCKAIVEAHGGTISVMDNLPHGAVFQFTLPIEEVTLYE